MKIRPTVDHAMPDRHRLGLVAVCEKRYYDMLPRAAGLRSAFGMGASTR